jgi:hypothetical protein
MQKLLKISYVLLLIVLQCFGQESDNSLAGQHDPDSTEVKGRYQSYGAKESSEMQPSKMQDLTLQSHVMPQTDFSNDGEEEGSKNTVSSNLGQKELEESKKKKWGKTSSIRSRTERLYIFQKVLLQKLGISIPPKIRRPEITKLLDKKQRERMQKITRETLMEGREDTQNDIVSQFLQYPPSCDTPKKTLTNVWNDNKNYRLYFNIENVNLLPSDIVTASLQLYKHPVKDYPWFCENHHVVNSRLETYMTVTLMSFIKPVKSNRKEKVQVIGETQVAPSFEGLVKFDMLETVKKWKKSSRNFGLMLHVQNCNGEEISADEIFDNFNCKETDDFKGSMTKAPQKYPSLNIVSTSKVVGPKPRHKRQTTLSPNFPECVKEDIWVNLTEQYKFILAPQFVNIGICVIRGDGSALPEDMICDATRKTPLELIFVKDGVRWSEVTNIIVKECGFVTQTRRRRNFRPGRNGRRTAGA